MALWHAAQSLGCGVSVRPVLEDTTSRDGYSTRFRLGKTFGFKLLQGVYEGNEWKMMLSDWGLEQISFKQIVWFNEPNNRHKHPSVAFSTVSILRLRS